jgi:hypothetical protein
MGAFDAAGQFAIRKGAGAAFAELDVGIRIQVAMLLEKKDVLRSPVDRLAALDQDGVRAGFCQGQGGEKTGGAGSDDERRTIKTD